MSLKENNVRKEISKRARLERRLRTRSDTPHSGRAAPSGGHSQPGKRRLGNAGPAAGPAADRGDGKMLQAALRVPLPKKNTENITLLFLCVLY